MKRSARILPLPRPKEGSPAPVAFDRPEFRALLSVYGRMVATGAWRDYTLDFQPDFARFAVFAHSADQPVFRVEKRHDRTRRGMVLELFAGDGRLLQRTTRVEPLLHRFDAADAAVAAILPFDKRRG